MGNDALCTIVGIRILKITIFDNVVKTLGEVRNVLDVNKNLILLGTLNSKWL